MKIYILEDPDPQYPFLAETYLAGHDWEWVRVSKSTAIPAVLGLLDCEFGIVLNLCDGSCVEPDRTGVEVIELLERLNLPFTGCDSAFYEPTRASMKRVCIEQGLGTPAGVFLWDRVDLDDAVAHLQYPLLVKHPNSFSSIGMLPESRVSDLTSLQAQVRRMMDAYGGALVEEFIAGREFSAMAVENPEDPLHPVVYPPVEIVFPEGETFKHERLKWVTYENLGCAPVSDPWLADRLQDMTRRMFLGMNGSGFGRCDFRLDARGELYLLEINPNCGVFFPPESYGTADAILELDPGGHAAFVDLLLRAALARYVRHGGRIP